MSQPSNAWDKPSVRPNQSEIEAYHRDSLDYLALNPESIVGSNPKARNPRYLTKAERQNMIIEEEQTLDQTGTEETVDQSLKLYPKGEATLESIFCFGKHKGKQVEDMIADQPGYISWLIDKEVITFDEETYQLLEEKGMI